jgi:LCP family protein required for cell wall assembly
MRWRRNRAERPPRVGAAMLAKALAGVFVVFICTGVGVAGAGYIQLGKIIDPPLAPGETREPPIPIADEELPPPEPGKPRTLLVLGSDRRAAGAKDAKLGQNPHSDTIVLVRLDPERNRIAVLSLPRDLAVTIPGYADNVKINQAYDRGGAALTLETVKLLFENATGRKFTVNSVIDVNFNGFQRAVNYVGGVYVDVDRRYYNPEGTGYAAIDVPPGYQRLVGSDALAYVRYRHTDSDIFRNIRQQDFLRQAAKQRAVRELRQPSDATRLIKVFRRYFRFDRKFLEPQRIAGLIKTGISLAYHNAPVNQIKLQGITESDNPVEDTRLFISPENIERAYHEFMTGEKTTNPARQTKPKTFKRKRKPTQISGLVDARRLGEDLAVVAARRLKFPFYFPTVITNRSQYTKDTPRIYRLRDEDGNRHQAYRLVLSAGETGEYWGVQGLTWRDPPILNDPDRIRKEGGREFLLFYDGKDLIRVGWKTQRAAYWVSNTLGRKISNERMLAIAASLSRLKT